MQRIAAAAAVLLSISVSASMAGAQASALSSHERMQILLVEIDERQPFGTEYLQAAGRLLQRVNGLPHSVALTQQLAMIQRLAEAELRAARPGRAFEHLDEVARNVELLTASKRLRITLMSRFWTGAFNLRQAMIGNCRGELTAARCTLPIRSEEVYPNQDALRLAIENLTAVVNLSQPETPAHLAGQWLLNLAYMLGGGYPQGVPRNHRISPRYLDTPAPGMAQFVDVSGQLGPDTFSSGGGVAAEDFDGDGWIDLMVSSADLADSIRLLRNNRTGGFEDVSFSAGLEGITGGINLIHADYDNDGDVDVYVTRGAWLGQLGRLPNSLLRNNGDSTFTDVTFDVGFADEHYPSAAAAWADYDLDGDLDLYVANDAGGEHDKWPSRLYRNLGNGRFDEVGAELGVDNLRHAVGAAWGDYDGDGDPDLYVSNFGDANRLYRNDRDRFVDVAAELGVADPRNSYTVWFWDVDNDADQDLFVSAYRTPQTAIPDLWYYTADLLGYSHPVDVPRLYRNTGTGFEDAAEEYGIDRVMLATGANFGDLDNDGFLDFYVATGYPGIEALVPNLMYRSRVGAAFQDVTWAGGVGHLQNGQAVVFADYDNDGDQDLYARMGGLLPRDRFADAAYRNPGFDGNWVSLELRGVRSNHFGHGAVVKATLREAGGERTITRVVGASGSFGANPSRLHLGLARAALIDELQVTWPASGVTQSFRNVDVNRRYRVGEDSDRLEPLPLEGMPEPD
jgi:hypothetical protein